MKDLILLHGALGAESQLLHLSELLKNEFNVHTLNFDGHGGMPINKTFSIELFSDNLKAFIIEHHIDRPNVFGYSMGGYVALNVAANDNILGDIITLGTKFNWTPESASKEVRMLNPDVIEEKIPKYAKYQQHMHAPTNWKHVMNATAEMMLNLGSNPILNANKLSLVKNKVLCGRGELDQMVTEEETMQTVNLLENGEFYQLDNTEHPIEKVNLDVLANKIRTRFLTDL